MVRHHISNYIHRQRKTLSLDDLTPESISCPPSQFDAITATQERLTDYLSDEDQTDYIRTLVVSAEFFRVLGVQPAVGRAFTSEEDSPAGEPVAILSDELWRRRFGADIGIIFGLAPALQMLRVDVNHALKEGSVRTVGWAGRGRLRSVLVVVEVSLALALTVGAGLLLRTFANLRSVDPGFQARNVMIVELSPRGKNWHSRSLLSSPQTRQRVLALQTLSEFQEVDPVDGGCSGASNGCSSSSGAGRSACSIGCRESEEMEW